MLLKMKNTFYYVGGKVKVADEKVKTIDLPVVTDWPTKHAIIKSNEKNISFSNYKWIECLNKISFPKRYIIAELTFPIKGVYDFPSNSNGLREFWQGVDSLLDNMIKSFNHGEFIAAILYGRQAIENFLKERETPFEDKLEQLGYTWIGFKKFIEKEYGSKGKNISPLIKRMDLLKDLALISHEYVHGSKIAVRESALQIVMGLPSILQWLSMFTTEFMKSVKPNQEEVDFTDDTEDKSNSNSKIEKDISALAIQEQLMNSKKIPKKKSNQQHL